MKAGSESLPVEIRRWHEEAKAGGGIARPGTPAQGSNGLNRYNQHPSDQRNSLIVDMAIEDLLHRAVSAGASDLHLKVGSPPVVRVAGELRRLHGVPSLR